MIDVKPYMGIPFLVGGRGEEGVDCWGLVRLVYRDALGIQLDAYEDTDGKEKEVTAEKIRLEEVGWLDVPRQDTRVGDLVILIIKGFPWHVGVLVEPDRFVHADPIRGGVVKERLNAVHWRSRICGFRRHKDAKVVESSA